MDEAQEVSVTVRVPTARSFGIFDIGEFLVSPYSASIGIKVDEDALMWLDGTLAGASVYIDYTQPSAYYSPREVNIEVSL